MSVIGKCEACGGETTDYRCLNCTERDLQAAKLQVESLNAMLQNAHDGRDFEKQRALDAERRVDELARSLKLAADRADNLQGVIARHGLDCEFKGRLDDAVLQNLELQKQVEFLTESGKKCHDYCAISDKRIGELEDERNSANQLNESLHNALAEMISLAEGSSGLTPDVESAIHKAKALIRPNGPTCDHDYVRLDDRLFRCEKCGDISNTGSTKKRICPQCGAALPPGDSLRCPCDVIP